MGQKLSEDHLLPTKRQRYKKGSTYLERAHSALFNTADDIIDDVYVDIANGVSRSDITQKLINGLYSSQKGQQKNMSYRQAQEYWNTALERMHYNKDIELDKLRDVFYSRYEALFEEAVKKNDIYNAKAILDSMSKIFGIEQKTPATAIQINNGGDDKIVINFGLDGSNVQD